MMKKFIILVLSFCWITPAKAQVLPDFTTLVEQLSPTVVNITIEVNNLDDFEEETSSKVSSGSGFIISKDGYIVTNKHVIDNAKDVTVTTSDNKIYDAKIIGIDDKTDLAVIKIVPEGELKSVIFGDSDKIKVGEWIFAIGNPFGLGGTVTKGIISAKSRDIDSGNYDNFIQTDASINRGNSGGPMFNLDGELIGINTAIFSTSGTSMGISFAIPINQAQWVIKQLKESGTVKRGWIGIKIQANTPEIAKSMGMKDNLGVVVSALTHNSPAQKASIKVSDIIIGIDDIKIDNTKNLSRIIAEKPIGTTSKIRIFRDGKELAIQVPIEEMPKEKEVVSERTIMRKVIEANTHLVNELGLFVTESQYGIIINSVKPDSDSAKKGLMVGDIIIKVDNKNVFSAEDVIKAADEAKLEEMRPVVLQIESDGLTHFVTVELEKND